MPAIFLKPESSDQWLGIEPDPRELLISFPAEPMRMWPISNRVSRRRMRARHCSTQPSSVTRSSGDSQMHACIFIPADSHLSEELESFVSARTLGLPPRFAPMVNRTQVYAFFYISLCGLRHR